ncbi:MAG: DUF3488 and transglutaminase-like domain-containing protein, partial [Verrucomicrobiota bacterium]
IPLLDHLAGWAAALFFLATFTRICLSRPSSRMPSIPLKLALLSASTAGLYLSYGTLLGIEPSISLLLLLIALKSLESNTPRDFQILALLGFFLALCSLFFNQSLTVGLFISLLFILFTLALVQFHSSIHSPHPLRSLALSAKITALILLQSIPIVILLFLFFPRAKPQFVLRFSPPNLNSSGMSDRLSPGSVANLALGEETVFRAEFPDHPPPPMHSLYWRTSVFWRGQGLEWTRGPRFAPERRHSSLFGPDTIRQKILLQPHGGSWLFALDCPLSSPPDSSLEAGSFIQSLHPIRQQLQYQVVSNLSPKADPLPDDQRLEALRQPSKISPRLRQLVDSSRQAHPDDRAFINSILLYFHQEHFTYSLEPGTYGPDALDEFLFTRRRGFCEHYAAALASILRIANIPSRLVVGYHGGEYNSRGRYLIVRQADAHAWCEAYIDGTGWIRIDPTDVIAPDRLASGSLSYQQDQHNAQSPPRPSTSTGWLQIFHDAQLAWDDLSYRWDLRILGFDEESQRSFLARLGLASLDWPKLLLLILLSSTLPLALLILWIRSRSLTPTDPLRLAYFHFCQKFAAAGLPRSPHESPTHFGIRAATHFPHLSTLITEITSTYSLLRYS